MELYIFFDSGIVLIGVIVLLLIAILGCATALDVIITFFVGPLKYILLLLAILVILYEAYIVISNSEFNYFQRIIGGVTNAICSFITVGISFLFLLCIFIGFLQNVDEGHPIVAVFAIISDLIVFILCFVGLIFVRGIPYACITDKFPILFFEISNYILSVIFFCIVQGLIIGFYKGTMELIFKDWPQIIDCLCYPFGEIILKSIHISF